jgi:hypothetical protein
VPVIVTEFFALPNIPQGNDPDAARNDLSYTVRIAGVVDIPGTIFGGITIDIVLGTNEKNIDIPLREALCCFLPRNLLTGILKNPRAFLDWLGGKYTFPVNVRSANSDLDLHVSCLFMHGKIV